MSSRFEGGEALIRRPKERPGKEGGKRAENRRKRIGALCEAGLCLFLERGIEGVTVDEIAREAGMVKGNFYRYFEHKSELVEIMFAPLMVGVREAMTRCGSALETAETQPELFVAYMGLSGELTATILPYLDLVRLYLQESRAPGVGARAAVRLFADELVVHATQLTEAAHKHGLFRPIPSKLSSLIVLGAIERLLMDFLEGTLEEAPEVVAQSLISVILDGIRTRED